MVPINKKLHKNTNHKLSIQISLSGLSFCILDSDKKVITSLKQIEFDKKLNPLEVLDYLKETFRVDQALNQSFGSVCVLHTNELSTLVSKDLFDENALADYLKFNSKILKTDFIAYDTINDMVNVYVPYVNINNFVYDTFGAFTYKHFSTVLLENILFMEKKGKSTMVYVHVGLNHFEIVVVDQGKLILYNTFEYHNKEDFIYYILFTYEQLELNPEQHQLLLLGDLSRDSDLYHICYKYVRHVDFGAPPNNYKFTEEPSQNHSDFVILNSF
ncbi:DUF3822 family protein [Aestuariivivens sediminis]|uniref:DUF3822 family protein n=1 Tax=Aestuariivivens sediminis TaxID=2913557 RepID=UPI001F58EF09|nr:DUF3822 family protein [Aestuariivivens sediminis]